MNTPTDSNQIAYAIVDDALKTYPPAEAPRTLLPGVMARIQTMPPMPTFRLSWFDYAISLFGAGLVFLLWQLVSLPSVGQLQSKILTVLQQPELFYLQIVLLGGMVLLSIAVVTATGIFSWDRSASYGP